ncbi:MAG: alpha-glucan family phosphorylase [Armatimonadetes bacterium]|nr:alpha-glucan family phosphorylase [Armatimonadota bacterium]
MFMPRTLHTYTVVPSLPERLSPLRELAYNLRFSWEPDTKALFETVDAALWESTDNNPAQVLGLTAQSRLTELAADKTFLAEMDRVYADFKAYMTGTGWWGHTHHTEFPTDFKIAYFSAEFGITECLPIYSGGLGVLSGDHMKSASDLGLPLVGMGFLYQRGYFRQGLNADGWQVEKYPTTDFYSLPIEQVMDQAGEPLVIAVDFPGRQVFVKLWKAQVGRIPLYLLDTNLPQNSDADRHIAGNLYGGDNETRIQQEIVLGIGGIHALDAMGITPTVCHMNEGHSAFLSLERARRLVQQKGLTFLQASEAAGAGNLFTTHTPVPAGFDLFPPDLMGKYFWGYAGSLGLSFDEMLDRGRVHPGDRAEKFNMAALAFRQARYINGVSELHGVVTRKMVQPNWPDFPESEVPVGYVTNGIHTSSFLSVPIRELIEKYLGEINAENLANPDFWTKIDTIPDAELWNAHETNRARMVEWARSYQTAKYERRGASEREIEEAHEILDPNILTIGFARRFATYKRGNLLMRDVDRLKAILNSTDKPVQFVFAGKAHPKDDAGKDLIRQIVHFARGEDVRRKFVFLEDYELNMARYLVQGVDVWLNNPRRPMEASGTSGMKVVANGGLNFSVLDGWWAEGYDAHVGWAIGRGEEYDDHGYQDHVEATDIYETLEREIVPLFYKRGDDGLPMGWIAKMKASMQKLSPIYSTSRMVQEYAESYYVPAARRAIKVASGDYALAKTLVAWKKSIREHWGDVRVESVTTSGVSKIAAGDPSPVTATVCLGGTIQPGDVSVELYAGAVDADRALTEPVRIPLTFGKSIGAGLYEYAGALPSDKSGQQGFTVRVLPFHADAVLPQELALVTWE